MQTEWYDVHAELEENHWWFTARRSIVRTLLQRELERDPRLERPLRILDIGCGAGGTVRDLAEFGAVQGIDPSPIAVAYAQSKSDLEVRIGGLPYDLPFDEREKFDVITLLEVLEHVDDDVAALVNIRKLLGDAGRLIVTVPAFQFLWSGHDVINEHKRRYSRAELESKLERAGFRITTLSYYNTILFLPVALVRLARRAAHLDGDPAKNPVGRVPGPVNRFLHHLFAVERHALTRLSLPFGVSLIAVARPDPEKNGGV
jgi:2-polyprenyl-3-methyl-5-hydroxy-6-metoxy-1,4-benzoquinol methylase